MNVKYNNLTVSYMQLSVWNQYIQLALELKKYNNSVVSAILKNIIKCTSFSQEYFIKKAGCTV